MAIATKSILHKLRLKGHFDKTPESTEYCLWRDRLIRQRLKICMWIAIPCLLTFTIHDCLYVKPKGWNPWVESDIVRMFLIALGIFLYRAKWSQNHLQWLVWYASWSMTAFPSSWMLARGMPAPSEIALIMTMVIQATFLPFFWLACLVIQTGALLSNWVSLLLLKEDFNAILALLFWFWLGLTCTVGVYLYERLQRQEFESRRELAVLLNSVTHDLRSPVTGSSMVLQNLIVKGKHVDGNVRVDISVLKRLLQGSDRQLKIIDLLLETQKTSLQQIVLHRQSCNLFCLIESIVLEIEPILQQNRVAIDNQVDRNLPEINADPLQLWRVFNNLITNAIKHNPPGIELCLDAVMEKDWIKVFVADNGVGIAPKQQSRLFELYTRGDRSRYMPGLGMGLYLCRQIINAHCGEIGLDSHPGKGTTFWFTLPIYKHQMANF